MRAMRRLSPSHPLGWRVAALVAAVAAMGSACSRSDYVYVASSDHRAYFKVPGNWEFYGKRDLLVASGQSLSGAVNAQNTWLVGMDSDPSPDVMHVLDKNAIPRYPVVYAQVVKLGFVDRETMSLEKIRNRFYDVDRLMNENRADLLAYRDIVLPGGFHGSRITYDLIPSTAGDVAAGNLVLHVDQTVVVDSATQTLYLFVVRCESHCYRDNKSIFDGVAESWTVKER